MKTYQCMFLAAIVLVSPRMSDPFAIPLAAVAIVFGIIAGVNDK